MIEEAVGTSVYRAKRETHDKILTKKVSKLDDIDKVCRLFNLRFKNILAISS